MLAYDYRVLSFSVFLCLLSSTAHAQPTVARITTQHGIVFPVPSTLSNFAIEEPTAGLVDTERLMSDDQENPMELKITSAPVISAAVASNFPAVSGELSPVFVRDFSAGVMDNLKPMFRGMAFTYTASSLRVSIINQQVPARVD